MFILDFDQIFLSDFTGIKSILSCLHLLNFLNILEWSVIKARQVKCAYESLQVDTHCYWFFGRGIFWRRDEFRGFRNLYVVQR